MSTFEKINMPEWCQALPVLTNLVLSVNIIKLYKCPNFSTTRRHKFELYISYYNSANLCPSVFPSVCLSLDLHENRLHDSLQTRPMCCPEPDDVQYDLSLYGCGKIKRLLCVVRCALTGNVVVGNSADGGALYCLIGGRHRAALYDGLSQKR